MRAIRTSLSAGIALLLAGCSPVPETSPRVRLDLADGFAACEAQQAHLEGFTFEVFGYLDQPVPEDLDLTLHVVSQDELVELGVCSHPLAGGCAFEGEAWSSGGVDHHELTHVVLRELSPTAIAALAEGIAETLGTPSPYWPDSTPRLPFERYATKTQVELDNGEEISAGFYTTFLLEEFGPQAYLDLYRDLPRGSALDDVDARMREHLGRSLDELDAEFLDPTEARCMVALSYCAELYGPVLEPPFELERSLACDEPGTLGYTAEDGSRSPFWRGQMVIPRDGTYQVEAEGAIVSVLRCGSCEERDLVRFNGTALMDGMPFELEAGLHTLNVRTLLDGHDTFRLAIRDPG